MVFISVFGVLDSHMDIVHPGSFAKTLQEGAKRVQHLWMHDLTQPPVAKIIEMREVDRVDLPKELTDEWPDATGALLVKREYLDTPRGNEVFAGIKAKAIKELSFGYDAVKYDFSERKSGNDPVVTVRNLREARLWDTSDVTFGANAATMNMKAAPGADMLMLYWRIMAVVGSLDLTQKSREADGWLLAAALEGMLQAEHTDLLDTAPETKEGRVLSKTNLARLRAALDTLNELLLTAEPPKDEESEKALTAWKALIERALALSIPNS